MRTQGFRAAIRRLAARLLAPVVVEIVRAEAQELVATKLLLDEGYQQAFQLRVRSNGTHRQCVRVARLAPRDGLILPLAELAQHLCLELVPVDATGRERGEERLEEQVGQARDRHDFVVGHAAKGNPGRG